MAKAKKSKPLSLKTPHDAERSAKIRRGMIHFTAAVLLIGAALVALVFDRQYVDRAVAAAKNPPKAVLKNRPVWMTDFLAEQIARCAQPAGTHSVFDHDLLVTTRDLLKANPWIRQVKQVRRAYDK